MMEFASTWDYICELWLSTGLDQWNVLVILSFLISIASLWFSWKTVKGVERIDKECQRLLLMDIIRHLYRNKVCTLAMQMKFEKNPTQYPSEEHFLKLQLLPKDLYLEQFYKDPDKFDLLHELELLFRNYNTEIEVAMKHISDPDLDKATKVRDFGTLRFKPDYLSLEVLKVMNRIWRTQGLSEKETEKEFILFSEEERNKREMGTQNAKTLKTVICKKQLGNRSKNSDHDLWGQADGNLLNSDMATDRFYLPLFADDDLYRDRLWEDVCIECGRNGKGEEKIHMIASKSRQ